MALTDDHKQSKQQPYWSDLVNGVTGAYKAGQLDALITKFGPKAVRSILDFGSGTSPITLAYLDRFNAATLVCADYDPAIVTAGQGSSTDPRIQWRQANILELAGWEDRFDLVFLLDMLHEVYSFCGRPVVAGQIQNGTVDHALGLTAVDQALAQVCTHVAPNGAVVITDNVLCPDNLPVTVAIKNYATLDAVRTFLSTYPCRQMAVEWITPDTLRLGSHDLCILLTQYNKIKANDMDRWNVEKLEIHQYMTAQDYRTAFSRHGFTVQTIIGTPAESWAEWTDDFTMIDGLPALPDKRITLIAVNTSGQ